MDKEQTGRQAAEGDQTPGYHTMQQAGGKWGNATPLASAKPENDATWPRYNYCPVYLCSVSVAAQG